MSAAVVHIPATRRGRRSADQLAVHERELDEFASSILQIESTLEFPVSSRGWCYILEEHGLEKGDFDRAQRLINDCRKTGRLPLSICKEDDARAPCGVVLDDYGDFGSPEAFARIFVERAEHQIETAYDDARAACGTYSPVAWNHGLHYAPFIMVEKVDLVSLFAPTCKRYRVPIANGKGWSDLHLRAAIMKYFKAGEEQGRTPVLLYCGDHDPAGLLISKTLPQNFADLSRAVGWSPDNLIVDRFGLNADFIEQHGLSWIENLQTGSGGNLADPGHSSHDRAYVQDYIRRFGARKVEANTLVVRAEASRTLVASAIAKYIPRDWPTTVALRNQVHGQAALDAFDRLAETAREASR